MQKTKFIKLYTALVLGAILSACGGSNMEVSANFSSAQGIKEGTPVYFQEKIVGEVSEVEEQNKGSSVTLELDETAAQGINASAAVVVNRIKPGAPLEIHVSGVPSKNNLQAGQELQGLNSMFELVAWSLGDALQAGTNELAGYVDSFQTYLQGEKFQQDKAIIEEGVKEMAEAASETMKSVEQELTAAMSEMTVTEEQLADAIKELGIEVSPLAKELAKSGTDLAQELDKFAEGLENATQEEQESGQKLIESLVEALERINESAQEGAREGLKEATPK